MLGSTKIFNALKTSNIPNNIFHVPKVTMVQSRQLHRDSQSTRTKPLLVFCTAHQHLEVTTSYGERPYKPQHKQLLV